ncbi:Endonuclease/exonuclease/phosphatase [Phytophthora cactorum]|nr:Endonuclease/exonuclease/phosphatase [Phytophthora cactorum]
MQRYGDTKRPRPTCCRSGPQGAGVAILVNPYGVVKNLLEWGWVQHWTEYLIMATGEIHGGDVLVRQYLRAVARASRIQLYKTVQGIKLPTEVKVVCGVDFNCLTQPEVDRCRENITEDSGAKALSNMIQDKALRDAGGYNLPEEQTDKEIKSYAKVHHIYRYRREDCGWGTSRLDRWYITGAAWKQVRGVTAKEGIYGSYHKGVLLVLHYPRGVVRVKKRESQSSATICSGTWLQSGWMISEKNGVDTKRQGGGSMICF